MTIILKSKIVLLGAAAVGKTSLLLRFVNDVFNSDYAATIGAKFLSKEIELGLINRDEKAQLTIWDIAGQPRFEDLRTTFYRGASGALLIYDLTRENTFDELETWYRELTNVLSEDTPIVLIGNKLDLVQKGDRAVDPEKAQTFAKSKNMIYIETSAKTGNNVDEAFFKLTQLIALKSGVIKKSDISKKAPTYKEEIGNFLVKTRVYDYLKSKGVRISSDLLEGPILHARILEILDNAIERAKKNKRKTVQPKDL